MLSELSAPHFKIQRVLMDEKVRCSCLASFVLSRSEWRLWVRIPAVSSHQGLQRLEQGFSRFRRNIHMGVRKYVLIRLKYLLWDSWILFLFSSLCHGIVARSTCVGRRSSVCGTAFCSSIIQPKPSESLDSSCKCLRSLSIYKFNAPETLIRLTDLPALNVSPRGSVAVLGSQGLGRKRRTSP